MLYCVWLMDFSKDGCLDGFLESQPLEAVWSEVKPGSGCGWPGMRGAHQLCFDPTSQLLYLHGGWDGTRELGDLWSYCVMDGLWKCLCRDTSLVVSMCVLPNTLIYVDSLPV